MAYDGPGGALFKNNKKTSDRHPDLTGFVELDRQYCRLNVRADGTADHVVRAVAGAAGERGGQGVFQQALHRAGLPEGLLIAAQGRCFFDFSAAR